MIILPNRQLTRAERDFNDQCEFEEGSLYKFPAEVAAVAMSRRLVEADTNQHPVKFREAVFLYPRIYYHSDTETVERRDYLFMARSRELVTIVPLVFAAAAELPRRVSFFRKPTWWLTYMRLLTASQIHDALHPDQIYEWRESRTEPSFAQVWNSVEKRAIGPRMVIFRQGVYLFPVLESHEFIFRVDVLDQNHQTIIGQEVVSVRIWQKNDLPKPVIKDLEK